LRTVTQKPKRREDGRRRGGQSPTFESLEAERREYAKHKLQKQSYLTREEKFQGDKPKKKKPQDGTAWLAVFEGRGGD